MAYGKLEISTTIVLGFACFTRSTSCVCACSRSMAFRSTDSLPSLGGHARPNGPLQVGLFPTKTMVTSDSAARFDALLLLLLSARYRTCTPGPTLLRMPASGVTV